jgi:GAF domain-containing protein
MRDAVSASLRRGGASDALALLNARVRFRFTGIYRVEPPVLRNVRLYDRENPTLNVSGTCARLDETFCALVWQRAGPFVTDDATADAGLARLTADGLVLSYAGVPVHDASGRLAGTLCHFDGRPRLMPPAELRVLQTVAPLFAATLAVAERLPAAGS